MVTRLLLRLPNGEHPPGRPDDEQEPFDHSYQIRSLEEELNTVLFDRYKKSLRITPEGKKLFEWTVYTFETLRGLRSEVGTLSGRLQGTVTFSSNLPFARTNCRDHLRISGAAPRRQHPHQARPDLRSG